MPNNLIEIRWTGGQWLVTSPRSAPVAFPLVEVARGWSAAFLAANGGGWIRVFHQAGPHTDEWIPAHHPDEQVTEQQAERIEGIADAADAIRGDEADATDMVFDQVADLKADVLLPKSIRDHPAVKTTHRHISAGAAWVGLVALLAGGGTFGGVVAPALQSVTASASIGSYLDFGSAFFATFSMSIALTLTMFAFRRRIYWWWQTVIFVASAMIASYLSFLVGLRDVDPMVLLDLKAQVPLIKSFQFLGIYFQFFGPVPFLCGLGVGLIAGNLLYRLRSQASATDASSRSARP